MDSWDFSYYRQGLQYFNSDAMRLRQALRHCPLFEALPESSPEDYIWDRRKNPPQRVRCEDGPQLFESLRMALCTYHTAVYIAELAPSELHRRTRMALDHLSLLFQIFVYQRQ